MAARSASPRPPLTTRYFRLSVAPSTASHTTRAAAAFGPAPVPWSFSSSNAKASPPPAADRR